MKKILKNVFLAIIVSIVSFFSVNTFTNITNASSINNEIVNKKQFSSTINSVLTDFVKFTKRYPGSEQELLASKYIKNFLDTETDCKPLIANYMKPGEEGIQSFSFISIFDENKYTSQNIIYTIPAKEETEKKVILTCGYDAIAYKIDAYSIASIVESQGVNQSAGSVALLLALAKYLPAKTFDFNIELVFFGASNSNFAGSDFYTKGIDEETAKDILLAINLDTITIGQNIYFYIDEVETELASFSNDVFRGAKTGLKEISLLNLGKSLLSEVNELGLSYTHIAQNSNNFNFMKVGVLTMNILAGDYESGITMGRCEYYGVDSVSFTENDNLIFIKETIGLNVVENNLYKTYESIYSLISNDDFQVVCEESFNSSNWFYQVFGNENLVIFLSAIAFLIFVMIAFNIHFKLTVRAYNANIETEFVTTVLSISANVDTKSANDSVPKAISEIIADDIKRDKRIRKK